jgi:hypothetical protein
LTPTGLLMEGVIAITDTQRAQCDNVHGSRRIMIKMNMNMLKSARLRAKEHSKW